MARPPSHNGIQNQAGVGYDTGLLLLVLAENGG